MLEAQSLKVLWNRKIPKEIVSSAPTPQGLVSTRGFMGLNGKAHNFGGYQTVSQASKSSPSSSGKSLHFSEASTRMFLMLYSEL